MQGHPVEVTEELESESSLEVKRIKLDASGSIDMRKSKPHMQTLAESQVFKRHDSPTRKEKMKATKERRFKSIRIRSSSRKARQSASKQKERLEEKSDYLIYPRPVSVLKDLEVRNVRKYAQLMKSMDFSRPKS